MKNRRIKTQEKAMKRPILVLCALAFVCGLASVALADDVNVTGTWKVTSQTPRGERVREMTLVQEGEKLTVTSKDREGNDVKSEGTLKGADITWTTKRQTPGGEMIITYTGKVEGKTMKGTIAFGPDPDRTGEWKAERVEPAAPKAETPAAS
jgi:hypothetical protein